MHKIFQLLITLVITTYSKISFACNQACIDAYTDSLNEEPAPGSGMLLLKILVIYFLYRVIKYIIKEFQEEIENRKKDKDFDNNTNDN